MRRAVSFAFGLSLEKAIDGGVDVFGDHLLFVDPAGPAKERREPDLLEDGGDLSLITLDVLGPSDGRVGRGAAHRGDREAREHRVEARDAAGDIRIARGDRADERLREVWPAAHPSGELREEALRALVRALAGDG